MIGTQKPEHFATRTCEMVLQTDFCYPGTEPDFTKIPEVELIQFTFPVSIAIGFYVKSHD